MGKIKNIRGKEGFTLIEVGLSLIIFTVSLLSALYVLSEAHKMSQLSRDRLLALSAARSTLELIKNTPLANIDGITQAQLDALVPTVDGTQNTAMLLTAVPRNPIIALAWDDPAQGGTMENLDGTTTQATITITIRWLGPKNMPYSFVVTTVRSRF